ncbi:hypothetical protein, partial [Pararhizobium sp.]|uniref:hypothetical protein n=1 Tax=Pararhizobium sp. TaxID=1977563 RepID=UPI00271B8F23
LNVLAGASYCEDTGGASGCFLKGQALNYLSEAVITAAYVSLGLRSANENGKIGGAEGAKRGTGARFADQAKLDDHFNRHGADFGATSSTQYQQMADDFLTGSRGV